MTANQDIPIPFKQHLVELRKRLFLSVIFFLAFTILGWAIHIQLLSILTRPLNQRLIYTSPIGGFEFAVNISLLFSLVASLPFIIFNIVKFISPAISKNTTIKTSQVIIWSYLLMISGMLFAYNFSLPFTLRFLNTFSADEVQSLITTNSYISFVSVILVGYGLVFLLPLIMLLINSISPLAIKKLNSYQGNVILFSFIIAAFLTPTPDPINQAIMAAPIIVLYEISIFLIWWKSRKKISPEKILELEKEANELHEAGNFDESMKKYEELYKYHCKNAKVYARLGIVYIKREEFSKAKEVLQIAIKNDPSVPSQFANLGIALIGLDKPKEAKVVFEKALKLSPHNAKYQRIYNLCDDLIKDNQ